MQNCFFAVNSSVIKDSRDGIYPSDHYFMLADLSLGD